MNRAFLLVAALVIGVGVALLVFQVPERGDDIVPEAAAPAASDGRTPAALPDLPADPARPPDLAEAPNAGDTDARSQPDAPEVHQGARNPEIARIEQRRKDPDALLVAAQGSTWTAVHRYLSVEEGEQVEALRGDVAKLVDQLRKVRLVPDARKIRALQLQQAVVRAKLEEAGYGTKPNIGQQLARLDQLAEQYPLD